MKDLLLRALSNFTTAICTDTKNYTEKRSTLAARLFYLIQEVLSLTNDFAVAVAVVVS